MNIDTHAVADSAVLVVVGMAVVFVGLFILMVAATIVVRLSQRNNDKTGKTIEMAPEGAALPAVAEPGKETIAALAVGLALSMEKGGTAPPTRVGGTRFVAQGGAGSTWAAAGREQQMRSRGKAGNRWGRRSE